MCRSEPVGRRLSYSRNSEATQRVPPYTAVPLDRRPEQSIIYTGIRETLMKFKVLCGPIISSQHLAERSANLHTYRAGER